MGPLQKELRELGEREFIRSVVEAGDNPAKIDQSVLVGFGDDAAVVRPGPEGELLVLTVDAMIEGTHFRRAMKPADVGYRLAVSNLSDLAAMGGAKPWTALLTFGAPADLEIDWAREFLSGLRDAARRFGFLLVGGDTVRAPQVVASLTLIGRLEPAVTVPRRGLARSGDNLYVTGTPGESAAGLRIELEPALAAKIGEDQRRHLRSRHFRPEPRLAAGRALASTVDRLALIDLSDGIYNEAELICEASGGLGAQIEWGRLPLSSPLEAAAKATDLKPQHLSLFGGEDYELLFATDASHEELANLLRSVDPELKLTAIGRIVAAPGVTLLGPGGQPLDVDPENFEHFG